MLHQIAGVKIPDSDICKKADLYAKELSSPAIYNHSVRTYLFGSLFACKTETKIDNELLYLGSILHDLGLTERFKGSERFEVRGADAADTFLHEQGFDERKREIVWDAIALHTSIGIASRKRAEIAFLHLGAGVDVVGIAIEAFSPESLEEILAAFPREDFKNVFQQTILRMLAFHPESATQTFLEETARHHIPHYNCPTFLEALNAAPFCG